MSGSWTLRSALAIERPPELVAFVGGGGKTSLMLALAAELPGRAIITTTTRIFAAQVQRAAAVCTVDDLAALGAQLDAHGSCLVIGRIEGEKALGVDLSWPGRWLQRPDVDFVLVEADGARMRPIKAPAAHEPVIPPETTLVVPVAGIDALAGPIEDVAHRPELVLDLLVHAAQPASTRTAQGHLTTADMAELLGSPDGGLKSAPTAARIVVFINKVESAVELDQARQVAAGILRRAPSVKRVVIGALHSERPVREVRRRVGAVVLAAGESRRMGRNKLLLPWGDRTVLEQTLANVAASPIQESVIVTGHDAEVISGLAGLQGQSLIHNPDYALGMLTSVQAAIRQTPDTWSAVLVVLGDQPMVEANTIDAILTTYAQSPAGLVVPRHDGRRGNPVLIDQRYFAELLALSADAAPRILLERHPEDIAWVNTAGEAILHDLDRPEDYARWRPWGTDAANLT